jgi:hypothetical protein
MNNNSLGPGLFGQERDEHGVRLVALSSLTQRREVIDIDRQSHVFLLIPA